VKLRKTVNVIHFPAVRTRDIRGGHLHDDAMDVLGRDERVALVASVFGHFSDGLYQAAAANSTELLVRDYREGHRGILSLLASTYTEGFFWKNPTNYVSKRV